MLTGAVTKTQIALTKLSLMEAKTRTSELRKVFSSKGRLLSRSIQAKLQSKDLIDTGLFYKAQKAKVIVNAGKQQIRVFVGVNRDTKGLNKYGRIHVPYKIKHILEKRYNIAKEVGQEQGQNVLNSIEADIIKRTNT